MTSMTGMNNPMGATGYNPGRVKGYKLNQVQNFTPQQMDLHERMFGLASPDSYLSRLAGGDQSMFEQLEAPALQQFSGLMGGLASRFSGGGGSGSLGARKSSGFQNAAYGQASDFAQQLQAQRLGIQRQAIQDLRGLSQELLSQDPHTNYFQPKQKKPSFLQRVLGGAAPIAGAAAGGFFGGPTGAAFGYQAGNAFGQAFQ